MSTLRGKQGVRAEAVPARRADDEGIGEAIHFGFLLIGAIRPLGNVPSKSLLVIVEEDVSGYM